MYLPSSCRPEPELRNLTMRGVLEREKQADTKELSLGPPPTNSPMHTPPATINPVITEHPITATLNTW